MAKTPIQYLQTHASADPLLTFQVELQQISPHLPNDLQQAASQANAIQYVSRRRLVSAYFRNIEILNQRLRQALEKIPEPKLSDEEINLRRRLSEEPLIAVVNLVDQAGYSADEANDFDQNVMQERWSRGFSDTMQVLQTLDPQQLVSGSGVRVHAGEVGDAV